MEKEDSLMLYLDRRCMAKDSSEILKHDDTQEEMVGDGQFRNASPKGSFQKFQS